MYDVINDCDYFLLSGKYQSDLPVLVLTRHDGRKLLKALNEHGEEQVLARIEAESEVDPSLFVANEGSDYGEIHSAEQECAIHVV